MNGRAAAASLQPPPDTPLILSITPALPGWWAVWKDASGEVVEPVACWALVEVPGGMFSEPLRYAQAMTYQGEATATVDLADKGYCGVRYYAPGTEPKPSIAPVPQE